jgi:hypothetical protein
MSRFVRRSMAILATGAFLALEATAFGAPRVMAVASGSCDDADLRSASRFFADSLSDRLRGQVLDGEAASRQLKPRAVRSRDEIQRQLASAQTQFYNLQFYRANQQVEEALREIDTLPPGKDRWSLFTGAAMLRGMIKLGAKQAAQADETFRRILVLDPNYQLDPDYYSPSTRNAFERARKQLDAEPKVAFQVRSTPPGAEVYLDGLSVGKTPFNGRLWPGKYQMVLVKGGDVSFPRAVSVGNTSSSQVDLEFEGSVRPGQPICISEQGAHEHNRAANAVKLGATLGLDEIVLVRIQRQSPGAQWLTASLMNVQGGNDVREGGLKMDVAGSSSQVSDLVAYIATGEASSQVVAVDPAKTSATPWGTTLGSANAEAPQPAAVTAHTQSPWTQNLSGLREKAWIPAVAGGALLVGGIVFYAMAKGVENQLLQQSSHVTDPEKTVNQGKFLQTVGVTSGVLGVVGLAGAGALYFLTPPAGPHVSLAPANHGAMASIQGTFP